MVSFYFKLEWSLKMKRKRNLHCAKNWLKRSSEKTKGIVKVVLTAPWMVHQLNFTVPWVIFFFTIVINVFAKRKYLEKKYEIYFNKEWGKSHSCFLLTHPDKHSQYLSIFIFWRSLRLEYAKRVLDEIMQGLELNQNIEFNFEYILKRCKLIL